MSNLLTATCTVYVYCLTVYAYTTHWSFYMYVYIIINKTIEIKKIFIGLHLFINKLQGALHRSTLKRVKMHIATAGCEGPL